MNTPTVVIRPDHELLPACELCGIHPTHRIWLIDGRHLCGGCMRGVRPDLVIGPPPMAGGDDE